MTKELIERLYASDVASALTNEAARVAELETACDLARTAANFLSAERDIIAAELAAALAQVPAELSLNIIRKWPDGFQKRLDHVWKDVDGFIPNVKLYDLQRTLAEFGFTMKVYEQAAQPAQVPAWQPIESGFPATGIPVLADIGEKFPIRACWIAKFTQEIGGSDFEGDDDYDEATDTTYWPEGWYEWNRFDETHWLVDKPVKNWALLPAAPEVK